MDDATATVAELAWRARDWTSAYAELTGADAGGALDAGGLERLATVARLTGRGDEGGRASERAFRAWLDTGRPDRAARCAWWHGMALMNDGDTARASGWFARAGSLLDDHDLDTVERGYLLVPVALRALFAGQAATALDVATDIQRHAARHGDDDLQALSRLAGGQALVALGRLDEGVARLDEAMLLVTSGELSPVLAGIVYCAVVDACLEICDLARAEEWTRALTSWCDGQPGLVPFRGQCLVDRAELLHLHGDWPHATERVLEAHALFEQGHHPALGRSWYVRGDLARESGDLDGAEAAYRQAAAHGHDPHPGLALLWLARGNVVEALAASRRVMAEATQTRHRVHVLAAHVEIAVAAGELADADRAVAALREVAATFDPPLLRALVLTADGQVRLARDDHAAADRLLRRGLGAWLEVGAALDAARTRVLIGAACHALGDRDTAEIEFGSARATFVALGAGPRIEQLDRLTARLGDRMPAGAPGGLTGRELEVLEQVVAGRSNREIADVLVISEKTVSRHLSNIYTKLGVGSRAAATAYAFTHELV